MDRPHSREERPRARAASAGQRLHRTLGAPGRALTTLALDLVVLKPLAIFVWWFSQRKNRVSFAQRKALARRIDEAVAQGRPVVVASNHVAWFDDPVIPMALHRTGQRAALELAGLALLILASAALPDAVLPPPGGLLVGVSGGLAIAAFGAHKTWWTLGDLVNLSDASVLRGKLALTRTRPPGALLRLWLAVADHLIPWFMRSGTVRTIFVDRREGEEARATRARAVEAALEVAQRPEPVWVFFEGGRTKTPGVLAPARRGVGSLILGLCARGYDPLVVVILHEGMERLMPPGGSRFLGFGHRVAVRWSIFGAGAAAAELAGGDDLAMADAIREEALRLQAALHAEEAPPA